MSQQDFVPADNVLELLREHPDGLTVREVAEELDTGYMAAQNALRELHMAHETEVTIPRSIYETQRWVVADGS